MKRNLILSGITILCTAFLLLAGFTQDKPAAQTTAPSGDMVKRGQYLTVIGGCHDCHSPKNFGPKGPEPDLSRALSGYPSNTKLPEVPAGILAPDKWGAVTTNDLTGGPARGGSALRSI